MTGSDALSLQEAWLKKAQLDAERDVIECRVCRRTTGLDETTTVWRDGVLAFALCDRCGATHELVIRPHERGLQVAARSRTLSVRTGV